LSGVITASLCVLWPLLARFAVARSRAAAAVGAVVLCYAPGILIANLTPSLADASLAEVFTEATIPLAIPLMLFSTDLSGWLGKGRAAALSFALAAASVVGAALALGPLFAGRPHHAESLGMLVGTYTGGTPNLMAVGTALEAPEALFVLLNAADTAVCGFYLLFLLSLAKPVLSRFYRPWEPSGEAVEVAEPEGRTWRARAVGGALGAALAVLVLGISAGGSMLAFGELEVAAVMLGLTTLGVAASRIERVRTLPGSYALGEYLVLVFCVAIGVRTDVVALLDGGLDVLMMTAALLAAALTGHYVLAKLFGVDVDTLIVTSTAAVFGPPFVGPVCEAIGNRELLLAGLTTGLMGYALGNYLGLMVAGALGG
jgi:uncharacterized membrane protein